MVKSSTSLLVRIIGMICTLAVSVGLGRALGPHGLGIINLAIQITTLVLVATVLGMDTILIKRVAIGHERGDSQEIASSIYTSTRISGILAVVVSVVGFLGARWLAVNVFHASDLWIPLVISIAAIVPQTFSRIYASGLNGLRKIWQSNLVNNTLSVCVVGIGLLLLYAARLPINVITVAALYACGRVVVFCFVTLYWRKVFLYRGPRQFIPKPMLVTALPLLISSTAYLVASNADGVMLGWLRGPNEVGLYSVAAKLAMVEILFLMISNSAIAPKLAYLYAEGRIAELEKMVKNVTLGLIIAATVSLIIFVGFGHAILSLWGRDFAGAYWMLIILSIGQFVNISAGCSGMLLTMCGHERIVGVLSTLSLAVNLVLNYFFIQWWGAVGAAVATSTTIAGEKLVKTVLAKRRIGVLTLPF